MPNQTVPTVDTLRVGEHPYNVIRGALLMRGHTLRGIASDCGCHHNFVAQVLKGESTSRRVSDYINDLLTRPILTN